MSVWAALDCPKGGAWVIRCQCGSEIQIPDPYDSVGVTFDCHLCPRRHTIHHTIGGAVIGVGVGTIKEYEKNEHLISLASKALESQHKEAGEK